MKDNLVKLDLNNKILHLTLNDPKNQNTLSNEMISELSIKFKEASDNKNVKVIINRYTRLFIFYPCLFIILQSKRIKRELI